MKRTLVLATAVILLLTPGVPSAQLAHRKGGTLKVATVGEPPTLDIQKSTTVLTYEIMWHVSARHQLLNKRPGQSHSR